MREERYFENRHRRVSAVPKNMVSVPATSRMALSGVQCWMVDMVTEQAKQALMAERRRATISAPTARTSRHEA